MSELKITAANFENEVLHSDKPVLLDFYADWCGPCKMLAFVLQDVDKSTDIQILKVNYDENPDLLAEHNVTGYPTLILFKDGVEVERKSGLQQKPVIIKMIQAHA